MNKGVIIHEGWYARAMDRWRAYCHLKLGLWGYGHWYCYHPAWTDRFPGNHQWHRLACPSGLGSPRSNIAGITTSIPAITDSVPCRAEDRVPPGAGWRKPFPFVPVGVCTGAGGHITEILDTPDFTHPESVQLRKAATQQTPGSGPDSAQVAEGAFYGLRKPVTSCGGGSGGWRGFGT